MTKKATYNVLTKKWTYTDYTGAELEEYNARVKAHEENRLPLALQSVRDKRNRLLQETDYSGVSDQTMSDNMKTYRQELRDITNGLDTVEKCKAVTWPTKPTE
tara:strand:- start:171 stop:479 length:309 start_codon:yes stop_codon:yes gene_type:complete